MIAVAIAAFLVGAMVPIIAFDLRVLQLGSTKMLRRILWRGLKGAGDEQQQAHLKLLCTPLNSSPQMFIAKMIFVRALENQAAYIRSTLDMEEDGDGN